MKLSRSLVLVSSVMLLSLLMLAGNAPAQPLGLISGQSEKSVRHQPLCTEGGRYVFGQISESEKDKFMLDTLTGRLWRIAEKGTIGIYLKEVPYLISKGRYSSTPQEKEGAKGEPEKNGTD